MVVEVDGRRARREHNRAAVLDALAELYGEANYEPSAAEIAERAGLAASQVLGLALCRYVLRLPPVVGMDTDTLLDWVAPTIQRYLTGAHP